MRLHQRGFRQISGGAVALIATLGASVAGAQTTVIAPPVSTPDGPAVLTHHNNNARTGANLLEKTLNVSNVTPDTFGKLFSRKVDGQIYGQPLYLPGVNIGGKKRNVIYVVTTLCNVYAFDADDPNASEPLWQRAFLDPKKGIVSFHIWNDLPWQDTNIYPYVGIISTPVIDLRTKAIFLVTKTKEFDATGQNFRYVNRLRKLDLITGRDISPSGIEITATVPGTGDGAVDGKLTFNQQLQMNRPGLLLMNDTVFIAFGAHSDITPYHGWVFAYETKYLTPRGVWCTTPNGKTDPSGYPIGAGGIWMSGQGLVADPTGNIYLEVGNGSFSADQGGVDYGDSFVKIRHNGRAFSVVDYFTPYDQDGLNRADADLGVSGPMLIPGTNLLVGGGKGGKLYLLNQNNMGKFNANGDTQIPQWLWTFPGHLHGSPVYWESAAGALVYVWAEYDKLKVYKLNKQFGAFQTNPITTSPMRVPDGMPGATLSVSADGDKVGTGIVWASHPYDDDALHKIVPGVLRAFDAATMKEIWNSKMVPGRDDTGLLAKFCPPTVVNGKVYMASFSGELSVFGLGKWVKTPNISPASGTYSKPINVTITDGTPGAKIYYTLDGSEPTPSSALYTKPIFLQTSTLVKARAFATNLQPSGIVSGKYMVGVVAGKGNGLLGSYYNNLNFEGTPVTRIDKTVNFPGIGGIQPVPGVGPDNWTARWTGKVQARTSGTYTFTTNSDDGVRLWVNGKLVVDNWTYHGATLNSGTVTLQQGQKYDIRLEFFEGGGGADIQLFWETDFFGREIIPQSQLYSQ